MQADLNKLIQDLKEFKYHLCGEEAIEKIKRIHMMPGVFAFSFTEDNDRVKAFEFASILNSKAAKQNADICKCVAEYIENHFNKIESKPTKGLSIHLLDEELYNCMVTNIDKLINAAKFIVYGNDSIEKSMPVNHLVKSRKQAENIYKTYLERQYTIHLKDSKFE